MTETISTPTAAVKKAAKTARKSAPKKTVSSAQASTDVFASLALESVYFPEFSIKRTMDNEGVAVPAEKEKMSFQVGIHLNLSARNHTPTKKNAAFCTLAMEFNAKVQDAKESICKVVIHTQGTFAWRGKAIPAKSFAALIQKDTELQKHLAAQLYPFAMKHLTTLMMQSGLTDMSPPLALPPGFSLDPI